jgi:hypothetical protein
MKEKIMEEVEQPGGLTDRRSFLLRGFKDSLSTAERSAEQPAVQPSRDRRDAA